MENEPVVIQQSSAPNLGNDRKAPLHKWWVVLVVLIILGLAFALWSNQNRAAPRTEWGVYKNTKWGFKLSYPLAYSIVDEDQDINSSKRFIVPRQSFEKSGYLSKLIEITNMVSTTTADDDVPKKYFEVVLQPANGVKSQDQLYTQIKNMVASSSSYLEKGGIDVQFEDTVSGNQTFPSVVYSSLATSTANNRVKSVYIYLPPISSSSTPWQHMMYRINYAPVDSTFEKIIGSFELIPADPAETQLSRIPYINESYNVLMFPPEGWYSKQDEYFGAQIMFLDSPQGSISDFASPNAMITLIVVPNVDGSLSADKYINEIKKEKEDTLRLTKSVSGGSSDDFIFQDSRYREFLAATSRKKTITVDGISGITYDYGSYFNDTGFGKTIVLEAGNKTYIIIAETRDENTWNQNKEKIIQSMMSFKLID